MDRSWLRTIYPYSLAGGCSQGWRSQSYCGCTRRYC